MAHPAPTPAGTPATPGPVSALAASPLAVPVAPGPGKPLTEDIIKGYKKDMADRLSTIEWAEKNPKDDGTQDYANERERSVKVFLEFAASQGLAHLQIGRDIVGRLSAEQNARRLEVNQRIALHREVQRKKQELDACINSLVWSRGPHTPLSDNARRLQDELAQAEQAWWVKYQEHVDKADAQEITDKAWYQYSGEDDAAAYMYRKRLQMQSMQARSAGHHYRGGGIQPHQQEHGHPRHEGEHSRQARRGDRPDHRGGRYQPYDHHHYRR